MKRCLKCGEEKPFDAFHRGGRDGYQPWCKPCRKIYDRAYHKRTWPMRVDQKRRWKNGRYAWLRTLKTGPCVDCGQRFHPAAMQFDHRPGERKEFDVSYAISRVGRARILAEVAKCDRVCANCHAVRTYKRRHGA
jgi:hypothetical protein